MCSVTQVSACPTGGTADGGGGNRMRFSEGGVTRGEEPPFSPAFLRCCLRRPGSAAARRGGQVTNPSVQDRSRASGWPGKSSRLHPARSRRAGRSSFPASTPMRFSALWSPCLKRALPGKRASKRPPVSHPFPNLDGGGGQEHESGTPLGQGSRGDGCHGCGA